MDILWFLIIGAVAGWLAGLIMKGRGFGLFGNIVVGIIGALIGGLFFRAHGLGSAILISVLGAIIFLFVISLIRRGPTTTTV